MRSLNDRGLTLIEMMIVLTILSSMLLFTFPRIRDTVAKESVRGAHRTVSTELARARAAAVSRGCPATLSMTGGAQARLWTTTCALNGAAMDTVGQVSRVSEKYGVVVAIAGPDSFVFAPTGIGRATGWTNVVISRDALVDTLRISPLGQAVP